MNKDEIINHFLKEGCTCDDGSLIPLRNCNKIRSLYEKDLKNVDCCDFLQQKVFEVYSHRLKIFLDIEEIKGGRNSH